MVIPHLVRAALLAACAAGASGTACAPTVDGPAERQRALDREDGAQVAAQLAALPGVVRAEVVLRRAAVDPLGPRAAPAPPAPPAAASVVVIVDDQADRAAIAGAARALIAPLVPGAAPAILVEAGAVRPRLARVGPFTVEADSAAPLRGALAAALALIAALAGGLGWLARVGRRRLPRAPG